MKKSLLFCLITALIVSVFGVFSQTKAIAEGDLTVENLLNESNWINLPGYEYVTDGVLAENNEKFPAEVTFGESSDSTGINMKIKGYYQSLSGDENGNCYSGIVFKQKVSVKDFSITLTINKLGASSSASPADDGWIGIGLMAKPNLWHTANTSVNSGMVALLRTANRSVNTVVHEVASDGKGYKVANFVGTPTPPYANIDLAPATEGATLRFSIVTVEENAKTSYFAKIEQLDFKTGEVITSRTSTLSLICPELYFDENQMAYLAISASTDNFDKSWDISIKNICGIDVGTKEDTAPVSPAQRAQNIFNLIEQLKITDYFNLDGQLSEEGKKFYVPGGELDVNALATDFAVQLYNANDEVLEKLASLDPLYSLFSSKEEYVAFLNTCTEAIAENYENVRADNMIVKLNECVEVLPELNAITLANEQETYVKLENVKSEYFALSDKAIEKLGAKYESILNDVILAYEDKLEEISMEKYVALEKELPSEITPENAKQTVFALVPAENIYESIKDRLADMEGSDDNDLYNAVMQAKESFDSARATIEEIRKINNRDIEAYENGAEVRNGIFYLPAPANAEDLDGVFNVLINYLDLRSDIASEITAEEKASLITACVQALEASIATLPEATGVTAENYLVNGYDLTINKANNCYNVLDEVDSDVASQVKGKDKLNALVGKLAVLRSPLATKLVEAKTVNVGESIAVAFGDMFNNYFGLDYSVTSNYGTVDKALESFTVSFSDAGEYTVEVTLTDNVYGQNATCRFTVNVKGAEKKKGCKNAMGAGSMMTVAMAFSTFVLVFKRKK